MKQRLNTLQKQSFYFDLKNLLYVFYINIKFNQRESTSKQLYKSNMLNKNQ